MSKTITRRQREYRVYLASEHWKALRDFTIERDGGKCVLCGSTERLQVHHRKWASDEGVLDEVG